MVDAWSVKDTVALFASMVDAPSVETFMLSEVRSFVAALNAVMEQPVAVEKTSDLTVR